jgi:hypothetical protein
MARSGKPDVATGPAVCGGSGGSAAQRQRAEAGQPGGSAVPRARFPEAEDQAAGVAGDAGGHVQQPVAQGLGLGHLEVAVQQQHLGPAKQVLDGQHHLQPDLVAAQQVKGEVAQPAGLAAADAVLDGDGGAAPRW